MVEFHEPAAEAKGVPLSFGGEPDEYVSGDPVLLAQAVNNLVDYALSFVGDHGSMHVAVRVGPGDRIVLSVADSGRESRRPSARE